MEQIWTAEFLFFFCIFVSVVFFSRTFKTKIFRNIMTEKLLFIGHYSIDSCFEKLKAELLAEMDCPQNSLSEDRVEFVDQKFFPKFNSAYKSRPQTVSGYFLSRRMDRKLGKQHWPMKLLFKA